MPERFEVPVTIKLSGRRAPITFRDKNDIDIFRDIFLKKEYDLGLSENAQVIFDIGSNSGFSVLYFRLRYPKALIFAFEPNPACFRKLRANVAALGDVILINAAASDRDGMMKFHISERSSLSSSAVRRGVGDLVVDVPCRSLDSVMNEYRVKRIDFLKLDIEGMECEVLRGFAGLESTEAVLGEYHPDLATCEDKDFFELFKGRSIRKKHIKSGRITFLAQR